MKHQRIVLSAIAAAIALTAPLAVRAESDFNAGAGTLNVSARVNFSVIIPKYAFIRVGTGTSTPMGDNATVNTITVDFTTAPDAVGNLVERAATAGSGDIGNGTVTVQVRGNNGDMVVAATTPGAVPLTSAGGDTIPWTQIKTVAVGSTPHPVINGATETYTATGKVVNAAGTWTYSYLNTATAVAAGTYAGTVTYATATP
jgi:hypothetical protein